MKKIAKTQQSCKHFQMLVCRVYPEIATLHCLKGIWNIFYKCIGFNACVTNIAMNILIKNYYGYIKYILMLGLG